MTGGRGLWWALGVQFQHPAPVLRWLPVQGETCLRSRVVSAVFDRATEHEGQLSQTTGRNELRAEGHVQERKPAVLVPTACLAPASRWGPEPILGHIIPTHAKSKGGTLKAILAILF